MSSLFLFLLLTGAHAKDACGGVQTVTDPFAGDLREGQVKLDLFGNSRVILAQGPDGARLQVLTVASGFVDKAARPGDLIEIALDGSVVTLTGVREAPPVGKANEHWVYTQWHTEYALTPEQLQGLAESPITAAKVWIDDTPLLLEVNAGAGQKLMTIAGCLGR